MKTNWSTPTRVFVLVLIAVVVGLTAWFIRELFQPLIIAGLIAYLLFPVVEFMHTRLRVPRRAAANIIYFLSLALMIALPAVLIPILFDELRTVVTDLLHTVDQVETFLSSPIHIAGTTLHFELLIPNFKAAISDFLVPLPEDALRLIESTSKNALWFLVIVIGAYYFMVDWDRVRDWLIRLAPESHQHDVRRLYLEIKNVWMGYLRGQVTLMIIVGVVFSIIWSIIGLPGALILGILGGLFSLVPDIGPFAASLLAMIVALLEGSTWMPLNNLWFALLVAGLYIVLINVKNIWLRPLVLGRSVHMHEGLVFIAIMAAVVFTGILGAFIIVPVLASAWVIVKYVRRRLLGLEPFPETPPEPVHPQPESKADRQPQEKAPPAVREKKRRGK